MLFRYSETNLRLFTPANIPRLILLLRNPEDLDSQEKRAVVDQKSLLTPDRAKELQQKRYRTIQIIRGNHSAAAQGDR